MYILLAVLGLGLVAFLLHPLPKIWAARKRSMWLPGEVFSPAASPPPAGEGLRLGLVRPIPGADAAGAETDRRAFVLSGPEGGECALEIESLETPRADGEARMVTLTVGTVGAPSSGLVLAIVRWCGVPSPPSPAGVRAAPLQGVGVYEGYIADGAGRAQVLAIGPGEVPGLVWMTLTEGDTPSVTLRHELPMIHAAQLAFELSAGVCGVQSDPEAWRERTRALRFGEPHGMMSAPEHMRGMHVSEAGKAWAQCRDETTGTTTLWCWPDPSKSALELFETPDPIWWVHELPDGDVLMVWEREGQLQLCHHAEAAAEAGHALARGPAKLLGFGGASCAPSGRRALLVVSNPDDPASTVALLHDRQTGRTHHWKAHGTLHNPCWDGEALWFELLDAARTTSKPMRWLPQSDAPVAAPEALFAASTEALVWREPHALRVVTRSSGEVRHLALDHSRLYALVDTLAVEPPVFGWLSPTQLVLGADHVLDLGRMIVHRLVTARARIAWSVASARLLVCADANGQLLWYRA